MLLSQANHSGGRPDGPFAVLLLAGLLALLPACATSGDDAEPAGPDAAAEAGAAPADLDGDGAAAGPVDEINPIDDAAFNGGGPGGDEPSAFDQYLAEDPMARLGFRLSWQGYAITAPGQPLISIDVFDDVVIAHDASNVVTALEADSARIRWHDQIANDLELFLQNFRLDDELLAVSQTGITFVDIRTGNLLRRQRLPELANSRPLIAGGVVIYGSSAGHVVGHNLATGFRQWWIPLGDSIRSTPAAVGTEVCAIADNGSAVIVDPGTGLIRGRKMKIFEGLDNNPVATGDIVFFASRDQSIWAFDRYTGGVIWRVRTERPLTGQPVVYNGVLFVPTPDRGMAAHDVIDGDLLWQAEDARGSVIAVQNGRLLVRDGRTVRIVDPASGGVIETADLPEADVVAFDAFEDGALYLGLPDGEIHKYTKRF